MIIITTTTTLMFRAVLLKMIDMQDITGTSFWIKMVLNMLLTMPVRNLVYVLL